MTSDERGTRPSKAALEARDKAMAHQERAQRRLVERGQAALKKLRTADRIESGDDEQRITLADLKDALHETRQQPHSLPATNPLQVASKAGNEAIKAVRKLPPAWQVVVFLVVGSIALATWLGWLDPPERLPKQDVAPSMVTT